MDKYTSIKSILMIDTEGKILEMSNGAINLLSHNLKSIKNKTHLITDYVIQFKSIDILLFDILRLTTFGITLKNIVQKLDLNLKGALKISSMSQCTHRN